MIVKNTAYIKLKVSVNVARLLNCDFFVYVLKRNNIGILVLCLSFLYCLLLEEGTLSIYLQAMLTQRSNDQSTVFFVANSYGGKIISAEALQLIKKKAFSPIWQCKKAFFKSFGIKAKELSCFGIWTSLDIR